jgi:hypothetical protein
MNSPTAETKRISPYNIQNIPNVGKRPLAFRSTMPFEVIIGFFGLPPLY